MKHFLEYTLPAERIAQRPIGRGEARAQSKLLRASFKPHVPNSLEISNHSFNEILGFLRKGDVLVLNDTEVVPSRFFVSFPNVERKIEILLTLQRSSSANVETWEALAKPMRKLKEGIVFDLEEGLECTCLGRTENNSRVLLEIRTKDKGPSVSWRLRTLGLMPIPPYIRGGVADSLDRESYQTVIAKEPGSIACPTAGLHFTEQLLSDISNKGVEVHTVTLHVGTASFSPIRDADIEEHKMLEERYCLKEKTCWAICKAKQEGRRVVVVGTTCVRALESAARQKEYSLLSGDDTGASSFSGRDTRFLSTDLFITPGFDFKVVDCLITNFHQPCSTHLLLVGAFAGSNNIERIYNHALNGDYRFLSYGDSMMLEPV